MARWTRICCAVDLSDPSHAALHVAASLAAAERAELTLIHVFRTPAPAVATPDLLAQPSEDPTGRALRDLEPSMKEWKADAERLAGGAPVRAMLLHGDAAEEVVRFATAHGCDLVVVGTHGRRGMARLVLGSVAERIVRESPVSVLVARGPIAHEP